MTLKRILTLLFFIGVIPSTLLAQSEIPNNLIVRSTPQGALVELKGDVIVTGVAPANFRHLLVGSYALKVSMKGYENYNTKLMLDPTRPMEVDIRLAPKTRFKSFARSLFLPGWGQRYSDQKFKGYLFTLFSIGATAAYFVADEKFDDKYDEFNRLTRQYDALPTIVEKQELYPSLVKAREDAYDAENIRRITIGTAIGIWGLNVLDALFFFPDNRGTISIKGITMKPEYDGQTSKIQLSMNF